MAVGQGVRSFPASAGRGGPPPPASVSSSESGDDNNGTSLTWLFYFCLHWVYIQLFKFHFNWSIIGLQGCISFCWTTTWVSFLVVVHSLSCVRLFVTPRAAACLASLSFTISWSLLKLMSVDSMMSSNHLILCQPLLLLPSIFLSIRVFSNEL